MKKHFLIILLLCIDTISKAQESKNIYQPKELFQLASEYNNSIKINELQNEIAKITKKISYLSVLNPRIPTTYQNINNINQQVSFLPGQSFGLPAGSFKEVTMGQQYVSTFSIQPQFDILNIGAISQVKSAKLNLELSKNQEKINIQNLHEKISSIYFNLLSFYSQKELIEQNLELANQLFTIALNKYNEGIIRKQDLNEAEINKLNLIDKLEQLKFNIIIQENALQLFFENKIKLTLKQNIWNTITLVNDIKVSNKLNDENALLQTKIAKQDLKTILWQHTPVVSFVSSYNWQNLSNQGFYERTSNNINFSYIWLKVSYDFPTTVQKHTQYDTKKIQLKLANYNYEHSQNETTNRNEQLVIEYKKALSQFENAQKITKLKEDNFTKTNNQYVENIIPIEKLIQSQNELILSKLNEISYLTLIGFLKTKIEIQNEN
jgi:outer membrane protein TolC